MDEPEQGLDPPHAATIPAARSADPGALPAIPSGEDGARPADRRRATRRGLVIALYAVLLTYVSIATFQPRFRVMTPRLDNGWRYAINYGPNAGLKFGPNMDFTYGPLGYLLEPFEVGSNMVQSLSFWIAVQVALVLMFGLSFVRLRSPPAAAAFAAGFVLAVALGMFPEYYPLLLLGLALSLGLEASGTTQTVTITAAGVLAAVLVFIKFTLGVAGLAMLVVAMAFLVARDRRRAWMALAFGLGCYVVAFLLLAARFMGSFANLGRWLHASVDIAQGYNVVMSEPVEAAIVLAGLVSLGLYVAIAVGALLGRPRIWPQAILPVLFLPIVWAAFKHGFVHHQGQHLFPVLLGVLSLLMLKVTARRHLVVLGAVYVAILAAAIPTSCRLDTMAYCHGGRRIPKGHVALDRIRIVADGERGFALIRDVLDFSHFRARQVQSALPKLRRRRLDPAMLEQIRTTGGTVDALPWDILDIKANGLPWNPNPILQTYSAYTTFLDHLSAEHFEGPDAPQFVLVRFESIERRHLVLDVPATWQALLTNYRAVSLDPGRRVLLLEKDLRPRSPRTRTLGVETGSFRKWIDVPSSPALVLAAVRLKLTPFGLLTEAAWSVAPVYIEVQDQTGEVRKYRIAPGTADDGMLLSQLPRDLFELNDVFQRAPIRRVTRFRISGPGTGSFESRFQITWESLVGR